MDEKDKLALIDDVTSFWVPPDKQVPVLKQVPDTATFLREYVAQNRPVIIEGLLEGPDWPNDDFWRPENLIKATGDQKVRINVTPDGLGDAVKGDLFVKPFETEMTMHDFFENLRHKPPGQVAYLSHQNDNLRQEFGSLKDKIPPTLDLAKAAFGGDLDACNLWIGDERAVSSMHMDHYENLYCVVHGEKMFHLLPPCIHPKVFLKEDEFQEAHYEFDEVSGTWQVIVEDSKVPWIPIDPVHEVGAIYESCLIECKVRKGQVLYLPAMWLHRVTQTEMTMAVNYWFDMAFDFRWIYFQIMSRYAEQNQTKPNDEESVSN